MWGTILNALVKELETNPQLITMVIQLIQTIADTVKANPSMASDAIAAFAPKKAA